jgi:hypothetical protein
MVSMPRSQLDETEEVRLVGLGRVELPTNGCSESRLQICELLAVFPETCTNASHNQFLRPASLPFFGGDRRSANGLGHLHGGRIRLLLPCRNRRFVLSDWFRRPARLFDFLFLWFSFLSTACVFVAHDFLLSVYQPYRGCHSSHDSPLPSRRS